MKCLYDDGRRRHEDVRMRMLEVTDAKGRQVRITINPLALCGACAQRAVLQYQSGGWFA